LQGQVLSFTHYKKGVGDYFLWGCLAVEVARCVTPKVEAHTLLCAGCVPTYQHQPYSAIHSHHGWGRKGSKYAFFSTQANSGEEVIQEWHS
jgi:hypothetical protein